MNIQCRNRFLSLSVSRRQGRLLAAWLLAFLIGSASAAFADDVLFSSGNYSVSGDAVTLTMYGIENYSATTSGTLRMELWAFTSPYSATSGAVSTGYRLAVSPDLGQLDADSYFETNPITATVAFTPPQPGTYYLALVLSEYADGTSDDGFFFDDYANDQSPTTYGAITGADFGVSSAVSVGNGYFYDTDLDYIYPLGNGFIYLSDLNRYYYIDPGTDFTTGTYIYDFFYSSYTYTEKSFWPYVYYFDGTGWVDTGFN